ncbi:hypothetical protein [Ferrimicrobium sp.]|uniref:hypothetical protein n=1 Tax=Ferrimicrobium sp. TaxID=2926050 RepID=UPI00262A4C41|nr:hypothetical protein [Ferrimicrobium sp.]
MSFIAGIQRQTSDLHYPTGRREQTLRVGGWGLRWWGGAVGCGATIVTGGITRSRSNSLAGGGHCTSEGGGLGERML